MKLTTKRAVILVLALLASAAAALWAKSTYLDQARLIPAQFAPLEGVEAERARFMVDSVFGANMDPKERAALATAKLSATPIAMDGDPNGGTVLRAESPELCVKGSCLISIMKNLPTSDTYEPVYYTYAETVKVSNKPYNGRPVFVLDEGTGQRFITVLEWDDDGHGPAYQSRVVEAPR